jgi:hypothetical protein
MQRNELDPVYVIIVRREPYVYCYATRVYMGQRNELKKFGVRFRRSGSVEFGDREHTWFNWEEIPIDSEPDIFDRGRFEVIGFTSIEKRDEFLSTRGLVAAHF